MRNVVFDTFYVKKWGCPRSGRDRVQITSQSFEKFTKKRIRIFIHAFENTTKNSFLFLGIKKHAQYHIVQRDRPSLKEYIDKKK